jgi:hypothetical protein
MPRPVPNIPTQRSDCPYGCVTVQTRFHLPSADLDARVAEQNQDTLWFSGRRAPIAVASSRFTGEVIDK